MVISGTFHAVLRHFSHFKMGQANQNNGLESRKKMRQILQVAPGSDLLADSCFSSDTGFTPNLHSNTSAPTALGLSQDC